MKEKKLLLVVDFQNAYMCPELGKNQIDRLEKGVNERIEEYHSNGFDVAFTIDETGKDKDTEIYGSVKNQLGKACAKFHKNTYGSLKLGNWLLTHDYTQIEICGLVSDMCVLSNAIIAQAACPETEIIINSKITASVNDELGQKALEIMGNMNMHII